jgi:Repeat of unknown function (DUF5648)
MATYLIRILLATMISLVAACGSGGVDSTVNIANNTPQSISEKATGNVVPIYRFARISNGAYFYTGSAAEADQIKLNNTDFRYEGIAFYGYDSGGRTVFRFANLTNGGYFYTASVAERDYVLTNAYEKTRFRLDTATFQVALETDTTGLPVYRLANLVNGAYLHTSSLAEVNYAVNTLEIWRDEGLKFTVPQAPVTPPSLDTVTATAQATAVYQTITQTSVFGTSNTPSWDLLAIVSIRNNSNGNIQISNLDGGFLVGSCSPSNALGINKSLTGFGSISSGHLDPGYPYALPISQFRTIAAATTITATISLQGCNKALFNSAINQTTVSIPLALLQNGVLSRLDISVSPVPLMF